MKAVLDRLSRFMSIVLALALIAMVLLVCIGAGLRYVMGFSLLWADETLVFAMVAITFLGLLGVSQNNQHLRMDLVVQFLPNGVRRVLYVIEQLVTIGICSFIAWYSWQVVVRLLRSGTRSNMAEIPLWLPHLAVLIGLVAMAIVALVRLLSLSSQSRGALK